jgi:hypothetical protein
MEAPRRDDDASALLPAADEPCPPPILDDVELELPASGLGGDVTATVALAPNAPPHSMSDGLLRAIERAVYS